MDNDMATPSLAKNSCSSIPRKFALSKDYFVHGNTFDFGTCGDIAIVWNKEKEQQRVAKIQTIADAADRYFVRKEIRMHCRVKRHPHIVTMYASYEERDCISIVLEKVRGKNLFEYSRDNRDLLPESIVVRWTRQLLNALDYMHGKYIAHLDVKPENILLSDNTLGADVKLCDFGCANNVGQDGIFLRYPIGTPLYCSPEMVDCQSKKVCTKSDIFSLGLVVHFVLSKRDIFYGDELNGREDIFQRIRHQRIVFDRSWTLKWRSDAVVDFMSKLIERNKW